MNKHILIECKTLEDSRGVGGWGGFSNFNNPKSPCKGKISNFGFLSNSSDALN
jgi:hypothetical protein